MRDTEHLHASVATSFLSSFLFCHSHSLSIPVLHFSFASLSRFLCLSPPHTYPLSPLCLPSLPYLFHYPHLSPLLSFPSLTITFSPSSLHVSVHHFLLSLYLSISSPLSTPLLPLSSNKFFSQFSLHVSLCSFSYIPFSLPLSIYLSVCRTSLPSVSTLLMTFIHKPYSPHYCILLSTLINCPLFHDSPFPFTTISSPNISFTLPYFFPLLLPFITFTPSSVRPSFLPLLLSLHSLPPLPFPFVLSPA